MTIGTRSLLFGAHCWFIHPWFVALAWWKLYGFPLDPRLWMAFVIHDWGYWGCKDMDGETDGEQHPWFGAAWMTHLFDSYRGQTVFPVSYAPGWVIVGEPWGKLALLHSRFLAKRLKVEPSRLCWADKLAFTLQPWWLYLPLAWSTGELAYYRSQADSRYGLTTTWDARSWHRAASAKMARVAYEGAAAYWRDQDEMLSAADRHIA